MAVNTTPNGSNPRDRELEGQAREALARYSTLRIWGHSIQIEANDGVLTLSGHVRTRPASETAERLIRQVTGVRDVKNDLYVDTDLEIAVARALAENPLTATAFPGILVGSGFGEIFLKGQVASKEIKQAAVEIAARVPGVLRVVDDLATPETTPAVPPPAPAATTE